MTDSGSASLQAARRAGVTFRVRDVMADREAADFLESRDIFATPVLSIDGELIVGFRRKRVDALLGPGGIWRPAPTGQVSWMAARPA